MPSVLEIGLLVERFKQTPQQLGVSQGADMGLLYRASHAYAIYHAAKTWQTTEPAHVKTIPPETLKLISRMMRESAQARKRKRGRR